MLNLEVSVSKFKNLESMSVLTRYSAICNKRFFAKNIYSQVNLCSFNVYIIIYFTKLAARISLNASQFQHLYFYVICNFLLNFDDDVFKIYL